ncbi:MAG: hypothetical protein WBP93_02395 [Pyrinomonadaceae bacterium]
MRLVGAGLVPARIGRATDEQVSSTGNARNSYDDYRAIARCGQGPALPLQLCTETETFKRVCSMSKG